MSGVNMEEYVGRSAFNEFMQIMYEQLSAKAGADVVEEIKEKVASISSSENLLTIDDIVSAFADFDPEAEGADRKVAAASAVKAVKDAVDALNQKFDDGVEADTIGGLGKDDLVKSADVIASWDDYDEETVQLVAATLIKVMDDKITSLEEKVDNLISSVGQADGVAPLDASGQIPSEYLPSYVDDVVDVYVVATEGEGEDAEVSYSFYLDAEHTKELEPESGKIYIDVETGDNWRWTGTTMANMACPKLKEITADEVQAMWDSIVVPEEDAAE